MDKNLLKIGCEKVYEIEIILKDIYFIIKETMIYIYIYIYNSCVCVCMYIFTHKNEKWWLFLCKQWV